MTAQKMLRVLTFLSGCGHAMAGVWIGSLYGGEIGITPNGQLHRNEHLWMLRKGFVCNDGELYIYRPPIRRRKHD